MKRSLILTSTKAGTGKKLQKTFTDVNQNATGEVMITALKKINLLTTNTYVQSDLVDKINLDTEIVPTDDRQDATFSFTKELVFTSSGSQWGDFPFTTNSDGEISFAVNGNHDVLVGLCTASGTPSLMTKVFNSPSVGTITVRITGTDNFKPFEQTYDYTLS